MAASAGVPGATTSRDSTSASTIGHARLAQAAGDVALAGRNAARERNLPDHIAAFQAARSSAAVTVFRSTIATVSGPTPPGTGRQRARNRFDVRGAHRRPARVPFSANCARLRLPSGKIRLDLGLRSSAC